MRSLDFSQYSVEVVTPEGPKDLLYEVKRSTVGLLLGPHLKLSADQLLKNNKLAEKILDAPDDEPLLLEEEEYNRLKQAVETFKGFNKNDVELVRRIMEAVEVEVKTTSSK